jgi:hypothetical protein
MLVQVVIKVPLSGKQLNTGCVRTSLSLALLTTRVGAP